MFRKSLSIIRPPGADACLVAGVKPGTLSRTGLPALPPSSEMHHEAPESDLCPLAERLLVKEGEEVTAEHLSAFFQAISPVVNYVHFSGQRWKDPSMISTNTAVTMTQRIYVMTHVIYPWVLGCKTMIELGALLGVCRSMIMRHMKDFNVAFGVFGSNQKAVRHHADHLGAVGTYVEAGLRGHETRRRKKAERDAQTKGDAE